MRSDGNEETQKKREEKKAVGCCAHIIVDWDFIEMAFLRANGIFATKRRRKDFGWLLKSPMGRFHFHGTAR